MELGLNFSQRTDRHTYKIITNGVQMGSNAYLLFTITAVETVVSRKKVYE